MDEPRKPHEAPRDVFAARVHYPTTEDGEVVEVTFAAPDKATLQQRLDDATEVLRNRMRARNAEIMRTAGDVALRREVSRLSAADELTGAALGVDERNGRGRGHASARAPHP